MDIYKSIRKPSLPPTKIENPRKGGSYKRPQGNWKKWINYEQE